MLKCKLCKREYEPYGCLPCMEGAAGSAERTELGGIGFRLKYIVRGSYDDGVYSTARYCPECHFELEHEKFRERHPGAGSPHYRTVDTKYNGDCGEEQGDGIATRLEKAMED